MNYDEDRPACMLCWFVCSAIVWALIGLAYAAIVRLHS